MTNPFEDLDRKLEGLPDRSVTIILILTGIVAWIIAFFGTPTLKVATLAWMVVP